MAQWLKIWGDSSFICYNVIFKNAEKLQLIEYLMKLPIYLDYAATTPVDPRVAAKMSQFLSAGFGNPSSSHPYGQTAKNAVDEARQQVAHLIHAEPSEIIWTSGATEANNLALKGAAELYKSKGKHIITMKTEHPSVLDCCQQLEKDGFFVTYLSPENNGLLDLEKFRAAIRDDTILVSIMHVNNETGVIQDIASIANITSTRGILFHVDAAQSAGKIPIHLNELPIDLMSFCAHKVYGPKGIGALYLRRKPRVRVAAQIHGGGHESGMRSGTLPTHQIVGMGEAFAIAKNEMLADYEKTQVLSDLFLKGLQDLTVMSINGDRMHALPNILNLRFDGIKSESLMAALPNLAISAGSACHSKGEEPSYVLRALGQSKEEAASAVRFSFGRFTTLEEINSAIAEIQVVKTLR